MVLGACKGISVILALTWVSQPQRLLGHGAPETGANMTPLGFIHGRFQPLHNDHMTYLLAGKSRCDHLVVGITNPDPVLTKEDSADPLRSTDAANPLTYYQRQVLLREALNEAGVEYSAFAIVPFPVNRPELYRYYVPPGAIFYVTIYDDWGRKKLQLLQSAGLVTEVMWERPSSEKGLTAATVRAAMGRGAPWEHLVPPSTARLLREWKIPELLRDMPDAAV